MRGHERTTITYCSRVHDSAAIPHPVEGHDGGLLPEDLDDRGAAVQRAQVEVRGRGVQSWHRRSDQGLARTMKGPRSGPARDHERTRKGPCSGSGTGLERTTIAYCLRVRGSIVRWSTRAAVQGADGREARGRALVA